jgi:regulator of replication initiation timing
MADEAKFTKEDVDKAIADAVAKVEDTLGKKRDELLDEVKELKANLRKASGVKPEDLAALETENDQLKVKLAAAERTAKDAATAKDKAEAALKTEQGFTHRLVVENGLREQLVAAGVTHPAHQKAAIAMLASNVQVAAEGDNRVAKVGDKVLADFVKEWAGTDEGKAFITAPNNSGGGAGGSNNRSSSGKTMARSAFNALPQGEQAALGAQMAKGELTLTDDA